MERGREMGRRQKGEGVRWGWEEMEESEAVKGGGGGQ